MPVGGGAHKALASRPDTALQPLTWASEPGPRLVTRSRSGDDRSLYNQEQFLLAPYSQRPRLTRAAGFPELRDRPLPPSPPSPEPLLCCHPTHSPGRRHTFSSPGTCSLPLPAACAPARHSASRGSQAPGLHPASPSVWTTARQAFDKPCSGLPTDQPRPRYLPSYVPATHVTIHVSVSPVERHPHELGRIPVCVPRPLHKYLWSK